LEDLSKLLNAMKPIVLSYILFLGVQSASLAQPAFPITGQWTKSTHYFLNGGHGQPYEEVIFNYSYHINDSVSSGSNTFYKLFNGSTFVAYIKTSEDKAWYGSDTSALQPLFDYTLQVGDTFAFPYSTGLGGVTKLTVTQVVPFLVGGMFRKSIVFSSLYGYPYGPVWIKGIGDSKFGGLEFDYAYTVWAMNYSELICFKEDGQAVYGNCTVGLNEPPSGALSCTYLPNEQNLRVNLPEAKSALLEIYSTSGVKILKTSMNNQTTNVPLPAIAPGMYIARLSLGSRSYNQKFIKH
jgi:hypothetical protein